MKFQHMLRFTTKLLILLFSFSAFAQDETVQQEQDSVKIENKFGLRIGGDISKLIRTTLDDDYSGFEINADYRLTQNLYVAGEIGIEEKTTITDYLNSTANGSYIRAGIDYNMYTNWLDMDNLIYAGLRVGFGTFSQEINSYTIYDTNAQNGWGQYTVNTPQEFKDLTAVWTELIFGIKAEVFNNLYVGLNVQLKRRITETEPDGFENLYIPGFGRTYDSGQFGMGYGYNISYLIPLYKKGK